MKKKFGMKRLPLTIILFYLVFVSVAQTTNVQFRVNMNYQIELEKFFPSSETVDIAGTFNGWGSTLTPMYDNEGDGIYVVSIALNIGTTVEFKCRINGAWNGREEFPGGGPNRSYTVIQDGVVEFWYSDEIPPNALDVRVYSSSTFLEVGEQVQFVDVSNGNPVSWSWSFPGGTPSSSTISYPTVSYASPGRYSVTLSVTNGNSETASRTFSNHIRVDEKHFFWWNDAVFYEVFVRSFKDSDGDGKGDLQGLIDKLDYLNDGNPATNTDLGITGIWLMPIQQSPSYHGYDVTDYRTVEEDYGTNALFKTFIQEAHNRGIKVIIDLVMNHTSSQHPWFVQSSSPSSAKRDWYVWRNNNPGTTGPWGQNVWHYRNGYYYYGIFWSGMPDLNYTNPEVKDEIFDVARFWLEEMNVDGFRLDAVKYMIENEYSLEDTPETIQFWKDFRTFYKSINDKAFSVGEAWTTTEIAQTYVNDGGLDYCFEFELAESILYSVNNGVASPLESRIQNVMAAYPYMQFGTFLTNHDINRVMNLLGHDEAKAKLAATILLTLPGIPYIYYGEEIGMTGVKPDENIRTPMQWNSSAYAGFSNVTPWRPVNSDYSYKNVEVQQNDPSSLWQHYRKLVTLRNQEISLRRGNYRAVLSSSPSVYSFIRHFQNEHVLIVANLSDDDIEVVNLRTTLDEEIVGNFSLVELLQNENHQVTIEQIDGMHSIELHGIPSKQVFIFKLQDPVGEVFQEKVNDNKFNIFPNPARDELYVVFQGDMPGTTTFSVFDILGRKVMSSTLDERNSSNTHRIPLTNIKPGAYFISFNVNQKKCVKKFIVQ